VGPFNISLNSELAVMLLWREERDVASKERSNDAGHVVKRGIMQRGTAPR
jgi:hypothetical protein